MNYTIETLRRLTETVLDLEKPAYSLRPEVLAIKKVLENSQSVLNTSREDITGGESQTPNGLALSPIMAIMCADDYMRTIAFIRGLHAAIVDIRERFPDRPARVLYSGCGPLAILAIPLMTIFTSSEASFTLMDIHSESIESANSIVETLRLSDSIERYETLDAGSYRVNPDQPPDIILIELMQACLESEPQVAITRHLISQAPNATLIPNEINVDLVLTDVSKEFDSDSLSTEKGTTQRNRISLGSVFTLNQTSVNKWKHISSNMLPGQSIQIPEFIDQRHQPMLFTRICIYQQHILQDYASGLTCPRTLSTKNEIRAGDTLQFNYELGPHPKLINQASAAKQPGHPSQV